MLRDREIQLAPSFRTAAINPHFLLTMPSSIFPLPHTVGTSPLGPDRTADLAAIRHSFFNERGWPSAYCWEQAVNGSSILKIFEKIKAFFPPGQGDTMRKMIQTIGGPSELDVLAWTRVGEAAPGYSPAATTFTKTIEWGHEFVNACMYTDAVRTDPFARMDLFFKPKLQEQMMNVSRAMAEYTRLTWEFWIPAAIQRASVCTVLNKTWGDPEERDGYPTYAVPTSILTHPKLEQLFQRTDDANRINDSLVKLPDMTGRQLVIIGEGAFLELEERYRASLVNRGYQSSEELIPELGIRARKIGKYDFVIVSRPRRFRARASNETWDQCIIPSHIVVNAGAKGKKRVPNPDYRNPDIAIYEEAFMINLDAYTWLVPPAGLDVKGPKGQSMFKPAQYSGEFALITPSTDTDPFGDTAYFATRFMSGMMPNNPERSRAILLQACHTTADDVALVQSGPAMSNNPTYAIQEICPLINGRLQVLITGSLPGSAPVGKTLFMTKEGGQRYIVGTIHSSTAFAGTARLEAGTLLEISFPSGLSAIQNVGTDDNPWVSMVFLPEATPSDVTTGTMPALLAIFATDSVTDVVNGSDASIVTGEPFTTAAALQSALNTYLDGSGTATVTGGDAASGYVWTVRVVAAADPGVDEFATLAAGSIKFSDGLGTNAVTFETEGV